MSINSLTAIGSGDVTYTSSALAFGISSDAPYKFDLITLSKLGMFDLGAMWQCNSVSDQSPQLINEAYGSLCYDYGSWTNANSPGMFVVYNDKYEYVELGGNFHFSEGTYAYGWFVKFTSFNQYGCPAGSSHNLTNTPCHINVRGVVKVSSGMVFYPNLYSSVGNSTVPGSQTNVIWIRPLVRTS